MKISIKSTNFELTPSLTQYIEEKLGVLSKFIKRFDDEGVAELWVEIGRTTKHHRKGEIYRAEANLSLPKKILRAVETGKDIRVAIDILKHTVQLEIEKYKTRTSRRPKTIK